MKRALALAALLVASIASAQVTVPSTEALRAEEDLAAARLRYGERHATVVALRRRVEATRGSVGLREDVCTQLASRATELAVDDAELATRYGERHPRRVEARRRIETVWAQRAAHCE